MTARAIAALVAAAMTVASCAADDGNDNDAATGAPPATASPATTEPTPTTDPPPTTEAPPTTTSDAELARAYAEAGPYPVGVTTLILPTGPSAEIWYPAAPATTGTVS